MGVQLLRSPAEAQRLLNDIFKKLTVIERILKWYYYMPRIRRGNFLLLRSYFAKHWIPSYAYFQEMVTTDHDWRIATLGSDLISIFRRRNRPNDFRASGSGLWDKLEEADIPADACDLALAISNRHRFSSMAYDFMHGPKGWVIGELSYGFLLNEVYTTTLFRKVDGVYRKVPPIPMGVMWLQSALRLRSSSAPATASFNPSAFM
jgi:hypothetical protein